MSLQKLGHVEEYARIGLARLFSDETPRAWPPRRLLVVGYAAIGDLLFFLPALRLAREGFPGVHITFVSDRYAGSTELLPALGLVDEFWSYEHSDLAKRAARRAIERRIREGRFDAALVSQASPLLAFAAGLLSIPVRVGHCRPLDLPRGGWSPLYHAWRTLRRGATTGEYERRLALNRKVWVDADGEHAVSRSLRLAAALGLKLPATRDCRPPLPADPAAEARAAARLPDAPGRVTVGLHVGSPHSAYHKIWPAERWGEACRLLAARHPVRFALLGGPAETVLAERFASTFGGEFVDLTGTASILETFALLRRCRLVLACDTGVAKAAMALDIPTATVWGPSAPSDVGGSAWSADKHLDIRIDDLPCSPCARLGLPQEGGGVLNYSNCGHHDCLARMEPAMVAAAVSSRYADLLSPA